MKRYFSRLLPLLTITGSLFVYGCGDSDNTSGIRNRQKGEDCDKANLCMTGLFCEGGKCRVLCSTKDDCGPKEHCENSHCVANISDECPSGFTGDMCDQCLPDHWGKDCQPCECSEHGKCNAGLTGNGKCVCDKGWSGDTCNDCKTGFTGDSCEECDENHWGSNCTECKCSEHGTCDNGINGNGKCTCEYGWSGDTCSIETTCQEGFGGLDGKDCNSCIKDHYGDSCKPCDCKHGDCWDGKSGTGQCKPNTCTEGWTGTNCDMCADAWDGDQCDNCKSDFYGAHCQKQCNCLDYEICNNGIDGDGSCSCKDPKMTGPGCTKCKNSRMTPESGCTQCNELYIGDNCEICANSKFTGDNCNICVNGKFGNNCDCTPDYTTYSTVSIGGITWMAENLRNNCINHVSADFDRKNDKTYGYLYTYNDALTACPYGWRLPTSEEFKQLIKTTGADKDSSSIRATSWGGSNTSQFGAQPAGMVAINSSKGFNEYAYLWASDYWIDWRPYILIVNSQNAEITDSLDSNGCYHSVRCLKDSN